eukprot:583579-Lingulodinium_polyedra.AAC.1
MPERALRLLIRGGCAVGRMLVRPPVQPLSQSEFGRADGRRRPVARGFGGHRRLAGLLRTP